GARPPPRCPPQRGHSSPLGSSCRELPSSSDDWGRRDGAGTHDRYRASGADRVAAARPVQSPAGVGRGTMPARPQVHMDTRSTRLTAPRATTFGVALKTEVIVVQGHPDLRSWGTPTFAHPLVQVFLISPPLSGGGEAPGAWGSRRRSSSRRR